MAAVSSCRKVSCYIFLWKMHWKFCRNLQRVRQRARPMLIIANRSFVRTEHIVRTASEKRRKV